MLYIIDKFVAFIACCLGMVLFTPLIGVHLPFEIILYIHIGSFLSLGLLYEVPEFGLDIYSIWLIQSASKYTLSVNNEFSK